MSTNSIDSHVAVPVVPPKHRGRIDFEDILVARQILEFGLVSLLASDDRTIEIIQTPSRPLAIAVEQCLSTRLIGASQVAALDAARSALEWCEAATRPDLLTKRQRASAFERLIAATAGLVDAFGKSRELDQTAQSQDFLKEYHA